MINIKIFQFFPYKIQKIIFAHQLQKKKKFKKFLRNFVYQNKIKIIFPLSHWELTPLAEEKIFYKKKKIEVIVSEKKIIEIFKNKIKTIKFLKKNNILFPSIVNFNKIKKSLPVIKKECDGSKDQQIYFKSNEIPKNNNRNFFIRNITIGKNLVLIYSMI